MSAQNRVIALFSFAILAIVSSVPTDASAQRARTRPLRPTSVEQRNQALHSFATELQQHTLVLQRTLSRYLSSRDSFTPYLTAKHFWLELRKTRVEFAPNMMKRSKQEKIELWRAYTQLEMDVLRVMLDDQLALYQNELELSEAQQDRIGMILRADAERKLKLLSGSETKDGRFFHGVSVISNETESDIRKVLFPEQLRTYDKRQNELRMIWTA